MVAASMLACSRQSSPSAVTAAPPPLPSSVSAGDADAGPPPSPPEGELLVTLPEQTPKLQFSADGRSLRVASSKQLAIYDTATRRVLGAHDYPADLGDPEAIFASADDRRVRVVFTHAVFVHDAATGARIDSRKYPDDRTIVARSRDLIVVVDGLDAEQGYAPMGEISAIDLSTLAERRLPRAWWSGGEASLTAKGDRLAITSASATSADALIYDIAARRKIATVHNGEAGAGAGGIFAGTISGDGSTIRWCHSRSGCSLQPVSGGRPKPMKRFVVESEKWTIALPFDRDSFEEAGDNAAATERAKKMPLTVRDARGAAKGTLDMAPPYVGFGVEPVSICPGIDRAVGFADEQLYVLALPSGKRERAIPLRAAEQADVRCAPGGRHAALVLENDVFLVALDRDVAPSSAASPPPAAPPPSASAGADATKPVLAPADQGFVDPKCANDKPRCGWGWASRCYDHLVHGAWGFARAACDKGLALDPKDPETRRMLFYNAGRVAERAGDLARARVLYTQSLAIREVGEVRTHLKAVGSR